MRQEANSLSERPEISRGMVKDKIRMQSRTTEKYELAEKKSEEALPLMLKSTIYGDIRTKEMKHEGCRDLEAREGRRRRRTRKTFSLFSHAGLRRWIMSKR